MAYGAQNIKITQRNSNLEPNLKAAKELLQTTEMEFAKDQMNHFVLGKNPRAGAQSLVNMLVDDVVGIISEEFAKSAKQSVNNGDKKVPSFSKAMAERLVDSSCSYSRY